MKSDIRNSQHLLPGLTGNGGSIHCSLFREGGQICRRQQILHLQCRACMNLCYESKKPEKEFNFQIIFSTVLWLFLTQKYRRFSNYKILTVWLYRFSTRHLKKAWLPSWTVIVVVVGKKYGCFSISAQLDEEIDLGSMWWWWWRWWFWIKDFCRNSIQEGPAKIDQKLRLGIFDPLWSGCIRYFLALPHEQLFSLSYLLSFT